MPVLTEWWGKPIEIKVGSCVWPENWSCAERLIKGDSFSEFRIPLNNGGPIRSLAIRVEVTGRTAQRRFSSYYVRVKITFPGDCEPDTVTYGWLLLEN